jgi:hypothetical protein
VYLRGAYPTEIVLAKSIERKPVAAALLATPKRGAKAGGPRSAVPSFLPTLRRAKRYSGGPKLYNLSGSLLSTCTAPD